MTKREKPWWIKKRVNPQLRVYYVACGRMSKTEAKRHERPLYGDNYMLRFDSEQEYLARIEEIKAAGESIH